MGFFEKLKEGLKKTKEAVFKQVTSLFSRYTVIDDDLYEELEEILICADMENGFPGSKYKIGSQMVLAATGDEKYAYEFARLTAIEAKKAGYNTVWSPIVDIGVGLRKFSDDRDTCAKYGVAMVKGFQDEGMVCAEKHFPGSKIVKANPNRHMDGHIERNIPSTATAEELMEGAFVPYKKAIDEAKAE